MFSYVIIAQITNELHPKSPIITHGTCSRLIYVFFAWFQLGSIVTHM